MSRTEQSIETESRFMVARTGVRRERAATVNGYDVSSVGDENVLKLTSVMAAQLCDHPKNQLIVHFKWVNYVVCELYNNKSLRKSNK